MTPESPHPKIDNSGHSLFKQGFLTKGRVETFSDGIFAIIVTLLILEIKVPHLDQVDSCQALWGALSGLLPKFVSWVISFLTICIIWVNHHRLFEIFKGINIVLFWLNVNLLLWVCFIPFPTALAGDYPRNPAAVAFYGFIMALATLGFILIRIYGLRNPHILHESISIPSFRKALVLAFIFGPICYLAAAGSAWIHPYLSFIAYFLIALYFLFSFAIYREKQSS